MAKRLYTLNVTITEGPVTEAFAEANPTVSRTIEMRGDQTLQDLHLAIFDALDRQEEHMYEFQFGSGPHDPDGDRYGIQLPFEMPPDPSDSRKPAGDAATTTIDSLDLEVNRAFGYWFDFGDSWYHQIDVVAIGEAVPRRRYPRVTERVGESPPQYMDWDEEE
jgi:hypothetical protein